MDKEAFTKYSNCFFDIPEDYEIKRFRLVGGGPNSRVHLNAKEYYKGMKIRRESKVL